MNVSMGLIDLLSLRGRGCIAVLEAYLDESGTHKGAEILCVAGYVGNRKEWFAFEKGWQKQLNKSGIACFHAKKPECNLLKLPLAEAIDKRTLMAVVCSVEPNIFNIHTSSQVKSSMGNAYATCAFQCAIKICQWAKENNLGPVSITLEAGQPNVDFVEEILKTGMDDDRFCISSVAIAKKTDFVPLQTADFLSHVCSTRESSWFDYLMRGDNRFHTHLTPDKLIKTSKEVKSLIARKRKLRRAMLKAMVSS